MPSESDLLAIALRKLERIEAKLDALSPPAPPKLLSVAQAAEQKGVSPDSIRRACRARQLRYVQERPGAAIRIAPADLARWITSDAVDPIPSRARAR